MHTHTHTHKARYTLTYVMKPTHKKLEKIDERLRNKPLQGGTSFPLHK